MHKNFFPTVVPVAAGGYFWIFFTSRRTYGNIKTGLLDAPDAKQLWVAALDIGGTDDISHPAFYLRDRSSLNGFGIEIRSSVDTGDVTDNVLTGNTPPQLVVDGMNFTIGGNQLQ